MKKYWKFFPGFTLVELLIVVGIIGILAVAVLATFDPIKQIQKGKDAQRKSDLSQIQKALEAYYNDKGKYPCFSGNCNSRGWAVVSNLYDGVTNELGPEYIKTIPRDSRYTSGTCTNEKPGYLYAYSADRQTYILFAKLENTNDTDAKRAKPAPLNSIIDGTCSPSTSDCQRFAVISDSTCGGVEFNYWLNNP